MRQSSGFVDAGQTSILKLGGVYPGFYDVGLFLAASTNSMKLLQPTEHVSHKTSVIFRACQMYPSGGAYAVPFVEAWGGYDVTLQDFTHLRAGSIKLVGKTGVDPPPPPALGGSRHWVAACHLERCTMQEDMAWPDAVLDTSLTGSNGKYWLSWKNCQQRWGGEFGDGGFEGQPYDDDEVFGGGRTKIPAP